MSVAATAPVGFEAGTSEMRARAQRLFDGGPTLEQAIVAAWDDLVSAGRAECPVCSGELTPLAGCTSCGSELS
jgi:hypothetical protein